MGKLNGKVAIVTGGASGIGLAMAATLAAEGARLFLCDRNGSAATGAAKSIGGAEGLAMDVASPAEVTAGIDAILTRAGGIDILINSAGVYGLRPWGDIDESEYRRIFDVNVFGVTLTTQAVAPAMAARGGGSIVNIASVAGRRGNPSSVIYGASKAAVISLTQSAALAFAGNGIRVNAIAPGRVITPMWDEIMDLRAKLSGEQAEAVASTSATPIPLGRMSTPADYTAAALFLASDDSAYMTGQTMNVDGGLFLN